MQDFRSRRKHISSQSKIALYSKIATFLFFGLIATVIITIFLFFWYSRDLPTPGKLIEAQSSQSTRIYDRNNTLLYSVYQDQNRVYVKLPSIPKYLQEATIAIEDKNFYNNQGFSITGYLRAIRNILVYHQLSGGSTLTQQLVKNTLLTNAQNLQRKIKELILSIQVNKTYSKDQILEMYLNDVGYGGPNQGVEAASQTYFGEDVQHLDLAQSAFLAGLPQDPNAYSPFSGYKYYLDRTQNVLNAMVDSGYITQKQAESAYNEIKNTNFQNNNISIKAPHFVIYVKQLLTQEFGASEVENGGLQVTTTLDYNIEKYAEDQLKTQIDGLKVYNVGNGAVIVRDPKTGEILAMAGSKDYFGDPSPKGCNPGVNCVFDPNVNAAVVNRQPGSSTKPILYSLAFEKGYTPSTMIMDTKTDFPTGDPTDPTYTPVNYSGKFLGPVQIRFALANSLNIPAVKMEALVGVKNFMQLGYNMGLSNWNPTPQNLSSVGLSLVLGGREVSLLDETTAYSVLANSGIRQDPIFILKVTDSKGNVLYQYHPTTGPRVLPADITFLTSHILLDNNARSLDFGLNSYLFLPSHPSVSVKTGTTDEKRDNWTIGYSPDYVVGVWVGNNNNEPMNQAISSGETGASPIWNSVMSYVLKGKPDKSPTKPDDVNALQIDSLFGGLPYSGQPTRSEYFIKGTEPTTVSPIYKQFQGKTYYVIRENDPVSTDGQNRWQIGIDNWVHDNHSAADYQWYPTDDLLKSLNISPTPSPTPGH